MIKCVRVNNIKKQMKEKCIIIISHSNYRIHSDGVEKYIGEISRILFEQQIHCIHLFPVVEANKKYIKLGINKFFTGINVDGEFAGIFEEKNTERVLQRIQNLYNIDGVHIHHLKGWKLDLLTFLLNKLNKNLYLYIHDYLMICPYCKEDGCDIYYCSTYIRKPDKERCSNCVYCNRAIDEYKNIRSFIEIFKYRFKMIIVPSQSCRDIWCTTYDFLKTKVVIREHLICEKAKKPDLDIKKIRIAYIGRIAKHKGYPEWCKLVGSFAGIEGFEFYYFGNEQIDGKYVTPIKVDFQDKSLPNMTEALKRHKINIVFLWSVHPETYCYTYYEALAAGCYVLTNKTSGNVASEVNNYKNGKIFNKLNETIDYLQAPSNVLSDLSSYTEDVYIPASIKVNKSTKEIMFTEAGNKYTKSHILFLLNPIWTIIYKILRGRKYT